MQTFNDGILSVYETDENGKLLDNPKFENIRFQKRVIGAIRLYEALRSNEEITDLIRIPYLTSISILDVIVIDNAIYELKQLNLINDFSPPCLQITLNCKGKKDGTI